MKVRIIFLLCIALIANTSYARVCNALVLEAGGDKGAYEAGVLSVLVNNATNPQNRQWDVVSGVSIGSILTGFISQYDIGDEVNMAEELLQLWENLQASDIYQSWSGGIVEGLLFKSSIFDESPVKSLLAKYITVPAKRRIAIASTDADQGTYTIFNESLSVEDLRTAIQCSSAYPVGFPYVNFQNTTFMDGGVLNSLNVGSAVKRCREIADNDTEIYVDSILVSNSILSAVDSSDDSAFSILMRTFHLLSYAQNLVILTAAEKEFPEVNFRYTVFPDAALPSSVVPLGFKHDQIVEMIQMGQKDAAAALAAGEGVTHKQFLQRAKEWFRNNRRHLVNAISKLPKDTKKAKEEARKIYEKKLNSVEL